MEGCVKSSPRFIHLDGVIPWLSTNRHREAANATMTIVLLPTLAARSLDAQRHPRQAVARHRSGSAHASYTPCLSHLLSLMPQRQVWQHIAKSSARRGSMDDTDLRYCIVFGLVAVISAKLMGIICTSHYFQVLWCVSLSRQVQLTTNANNHSTSLLQVRLHAIHHRKLLSPATALHTTGRDGDPQEP